jgi:hypothetical protein
MDNRQLAALVKENAAKAAQATTTKKGFGKKYDINLQDEPIDEAALKEKERSEHFFKEMKRREF